jgi:NAD(P)-dependent dehydrogenase (short-subunit alcohol dehydrogenase family)
MPKVIVTGSGRRLGRAFALAFADKGWDVAIHYNQSGNEAQRTYESVISKGVNAYLIHADLRNSSDVSEMFSKLNHEFGNPDVLVNNSGIYPQRTALTDIVDELWDDVINTNLRGYFYCSREFARHAIKGSRIVNIASLGGLEVWKQRIPYNVSKAGVLQLTRALARELAPDITVNSVCPGEILIPGEPAIDSSQISLDRIPMSRLGSPMDVFEAIYFFATCSDYITGQNLTVDGGYHDAR